MNKNEIVLVLINVVIIFVTSYEKDK
jgi:hypothetical protein